MAIKSILLVDLIKAHVDKNLIRAPCDRADSLPSEASIMERKAGVPYAFTFIAPNPLQCRFLSREQKYPAT